MPAPIDLNCEAERLGLSPAKALKALQREAASRLATRAAVAPRPDWVKAHKQGVEVPEFIKDKFTAELARDAMHLGLLSRYTNLRRDLYAYKRHHKLPGWLTAIPTESEWNDRQVAKGKVKPARPALPRTDETRAYERAKKRIARARQRADREIVM